MILVAVTRKITKINDKDANVIKIGGRDTNVNGNVADMLLVKLPMLLLKLPRLPVELPMLPALLPILLVKLLMLLIRLPVMLQKQLMLLVKLTKLPRRPVKIVGFTRKTIQK